MRPKMLKKFFTLVLFLAAIIIIAGSPAWASSNDMPDTIDPAGKYLFFMHGLIVEMQGRYGRSQEYGPYDYNGLLKFYSSLGFRVISEVRPMGTKPAKYAHKIAGQVRALLEAGVLPKNIVVTGFSKGGFMTLLVAAGIKNPDINYGVMAGCGREGTKFRRNYQYFLGRNARALKGRFLSMYAGSDTDTGTCKEAFFAAGVGAQEIEVDSDLGHGLFYQPRKEWTGLLKDWLK